MLAVEHFLPVAAYRARLPSDVTTHDDTLSVAATKLAALKALVPAARAKCGEHVWRRVVNRGPRSEKRVISRAYHKLREIALTCVLPAPRVSIHLCEAPGGFVQATAEFALSGTWVWRAVSRAERDDQRFDAALPVSHGKTFAMDLLCTTPDDVARTLLDAGEACLVTADGAAPMEHARLEAEHLPLLRAQVHVAVRCLRYGGTLVLKFFEGNDRRTRDVLATLTALFESVSVIKPTWSRPTNSECYVVARGFHSARDVACARLDADVVVAPTWHNDVCGVFDKLATLQAGALCSALACVA